MGGRQGFKEQDLNKYSSTSDFVYYMCFSVVESGLKEVTKVKAEEMDGNECGFLHLDL